MIEQPQPITKENTKTADFINGRVMPIYVNGADVLRQTCKPVTTELVPDMQRLLADMFATMHGADGIGLAAPQVGLPIQLFVVDLTDFDTDESDQLQNLNLDLGKKVFINPKIIETSENTCSYKEGCLSVPGLNENVDRPETITIEYLDQNMTPHTEKYSGLWARVIQHEYDHLQGRLFVDNVAPIRKQMLQSKLNAMTKGKYKANYKTK